MDTTAAATRKTKTTTAPTTDAPTTTTPAAPAPKPEKTPEQKAAAFRRESGELRRAAKTLGEDTDGGRSLLARAVGLEADADALAPRKTKSTENRPVCAGLKKDGTACSAHAMEGSEFCTDHRPVRARFTDAEWAAFQSISPEVLIARLGWGVAIKMAKEQLAKTQG